MEDMEFERMKGEVDKVFRRLIEGHETDENRRHVCKLTGEEEARFQTLMARDRALNKGMERAKGKLKCDRDRLWADLSDKHGFHGRNIRYDSDKGELYEILPEDEVPKGGRNER